jgi:putative ABC transport system permease protein
MLSETIRLALRAVWRNALRSFLTVLGVVIGVAAVIAMVIVGQGSTTSVQDDVASLGINLLIVIPGQAGMGAGTTGGLVANFGFDDVDAIAQLVPGVAITAPVSETRMLAVAGSRNHATQMVGTDNRFLTARDWATAKGRAFYESELRSGAAVCILGDTPATELFGTGDPIGASIRFRQVSCRVIGVLDSKGAASLGADPDDLILMPIRTFNRRIAGNQDVGVIYVSLADGADAVRAKADIERLMRERRRIAPNEEDDFSVFDMEQITAMLTGITSVLTGLLSGVAGISLLVGGIGIMNIMLVSVTERTREIGVRLAIGATANQVLLQFLVEAIVLSLIGGLLGIILGLALGYAGAQILDVPFWPDPVIILIAFAFSACVGIVFGYFPARRAARLDPIEALRYQ